MEIKMTNSSVGERIRSLRESRRLSRKDLAARAGLSAGYLYEIESGRRKFSAETLCRIAEALSVSCDYIMFGEKAENHGRWRICCETVASLSNLLKFNTFFIDISPHQTV